MQLVDCTTVQLLILLLGTAVDTLHPAAQFRLVDGYLSKHTNVFHAHFLQQVDGIDVANGNLNVK